MSSQPAVSTQVFAMEEEFGVELFERRGPRIALTHAGETRYRLAVPLVTGMNRVRDTLDLDLDHGVTHGVLAIGAGRDVAAYVLPEYLNRFREQYPRHQDRRDDRHRQAETRLAPCPCARPHRRRHGVPPPAAELHPVLVSDLGLITPEGHPLAGCDSVTI